MSPTPNCSTLQCLETKSRPCLLWCIYQKPQLCCGLARGRLGFRRPGTNPVVHEAQVPVIPQHLMSFPPNVPLRSATTTTISLCSVLSPCVPHHTHHRPSALSSSESSPSSCRCASPYGRCNSLQDQPPSGPHGDSLQWQIRPAQPRDPAAPSRRPSARRYNTHNTYDLSIRRALLT